MKLLAVSSAVTLLILAIYASSAADAALAYSPDNRPVPTVEPFIEEDEGLQAVADLVGNGMQS